MWFQDSCDISIVGKGNFPNEQISYIGYYYKKSTYWVGNSKIFFVLIQNIERDMTLKNLTSNTKFGNAFLRWFIMRILCSLFTILWIFENWLAIGQLEYYRISRAAAVSVCVRDQLWKLCSNKKSTL